MYASLNIFKNLCSPRGNNFEKVALVVCKFAEMFDSRGYAYHGPDPLFPRSDPSVVFTGSTTNTFKNFLHDPDNLNDNKWLVQRCLRTQNVGHLLEDSFFPVWASYFTMIGAITPPESISDLVRDSWEFFEECLSIPRERLGINIKSSDQDLVEECKKAGLGDMLLYNTKEDNYYRHKYGIPNVLGRNYNLVVREEENPDVLHDFGNVIIIEKDGKFFVELSEGDLPKSVP